MDREEAARIINECKDKGFKHTFYTLNEYHTALDIAIQALEQEPCEDAISRSEAIRIASGYCHWSNIPEELAKLPSVNPKLCEDAISRQAVIDAMYSLCGDGTLKENEWRDNPHIDSIIDALNDLPSVSVAEKTQMIDKSNFNEEQYRADLQCAYECGKNSGTEKTGRWEWVQYDFDPRIGNWHCSECRNILVHAVKKDDVGGIPIAKYCPNCGAKMVELQESEVEK